LYARKKGYNGQWLENWLPKVSWIFPQKYTKVKFSVVYQDINLFRSSKIFK
jgi:hypothetical protein